ncbi:hypothetical protein PGT21_050326 [Puccinia graminis f. sp. tritici]|uniref:Uncharacterized protein n=1 Tax=Puccinia graminis f. sp. tritici TaxID=56615 RepID=A0A5B0M7D1_PUCGR|nr:hypothetical protein PGT21_050326 [Puccinia graminis f. sp. tritici]
MILPIDEDLPFSQLENWNQEDAIDIYLDEPLNFSQTKTPLHIPEPLMDFQTRQEGNKWTPTHEPIGNEEDFRPHQLFRVAYEHELLPPRSNVLPELIMSDGKNSPIDIQNKRKAKELISKQKDIEISLLQKSKAHKKIHNKDVLNIKGNTFSSPQMLFRSDGESQESMNHLCTPEIFHNEDKGAMWDSAKLPNRDHLAFLREVLSDEARKGVQDETGNCFVLSSTSTHKSVPPNQPFWIPQEKVNEFLRTYKLCRTYADRLIPDNRETKKLLGNIMVDLSDQSLDLNQYSIFTDKIMNPFQERLNLWLKLKKIWNKKYKTRYDPGHHERKVQWILEYIQNVTKISTFLIITDMHLSNNYASEVVSKDVERVLRFMKDLWEEDKGNQSLQSREYLYIRKMSDLQFPDQKANQNCYRGATLWYYTSEAVVKYWREKNKQNIETNNRKRKHKFKIIQMIELIIANSKHEFSRIILNGKS